MELRQYLTVLRKWLWLIVIVAVVAGGASYYASSLQAKLYQASSKIMIGQSFQDLNPSTSDMATSSALAETYVQLVKTSNVLQGIIDELGLKLSVADLRGRVSAVSIARTQIIQLTATDTDPKRAALIANSLANQLALQGPGSADADIAKQRDFVNQQIQELQTKIQDTQTTITQEEESLKTTTSAREISDKQADLERLRAQVSQWQQQYTSFVNFLTPRSPNTITLLEPADAPTAPFSPNIPLNVGLAVVIGIILAAGVAFLTEYFDDTFKSKEDVTRDLAIATLGEIGNVRGVKGDKLVAANEPRSASAEAYRVLRTNISFSSVDRPIKTILITSPSPSEGKSMTAANLAVVMAQAGYNTILLDCDLRKPSQHKVFNVTNEIGLTNGLLNTANAHNFIRTTRVENLRILTSGPLPPNPAELLGSKSMATLIELLSNESDIIIVDSPPVLAVADAAILSRLADGALMVIDSGHTHREAAQRAKEALETAGAHLLGIVLNRIGGGTGYAYNYKYGMPESKNATGRSPATSSTS